MNEQVLPQFPHARIHYHSYHDDLAHKIPEACAGSAAPVILLGHSYGGAALVRAAGQMPQLPIAHLILLDPVPRWAWGQFQWTSFHLPPNVRRATSIRNPIGVPIPAPIRSASGPYRNFHRFKWHANIPGDAKVQRQILSILAAEDSPPKITVQRGASDGAVIGRCG